MDESECYRKIKTIIKNKNERDDQVRQIDGLYEIKDLLESFLN